MRVAVSVCVVSWCVVVGGCQPAVKTAESPGVAASGNWSGQQWGILLDAYEGPNHQMYAQQQAGAFGQATGLEGFWSVNEGERSVVYFGRYSSASDAKANRDLKTMRELINAGQLRARTVNLLPVTPARDALDPMDLRRVDNPEAVYTLEVGVFDEGYGADWRKAAERAAAEYRTGGEEAYFYHGPEQSLVTIGLFGHSAASVEQEGARRGRTVYHPYIVELQRTRHPHLIVNGQEVVGTDAKTGKEVKMSSFLVRIPE